jgi:uncharacterized protein YjiS (DUF1127 family)
METDMLLWGLVAKQIRRYQAYRRTLIELSQLDDRTLADINVSRGEITSVARRAAAAA